MLNDKLNDLIKSKVSNLHERADFWHPDPEKDRKLGGPGANQRAREDRADASKPKEDPKKLRPGESYMDWNKRQQANRMKSESYVPGKPAERLGAVTAIPQSERDAAKARLLAKTAAKRKEMEKVKEELEIEEGMHRDAKTGEVVDKAVPGRTYYPNQPRIKSSVAIEKEKKMKKAMGEAMSFSDFMEARRMDKEGVDRGDSRRAERADRARESLAAKQKRQAVLDKHEKKTGTKLDISRSKEGKEHARNFPGSRQEPKVRGAKETPQETQNRRINASNQRKIKHGFTSKERKEAEGMAKHTSRFD